VESGIFGIASSSPSLGVAPTESASAARQTAMAMRSPYQVVVTDQERRVLVKRARSERVAHREVLRAQIVLAAADGASNAEIARRLGVCQDTVRKWRARFCAEGLPGLADRPRPGRQRSFPKTAEAEIKALACELPAQTGVPLARWSHTELAAEAVGRGVVESISPSTVGRWLRADAIRPWRVRSWIFPRDPDFAVKAGRALDLYDHLCEGQPLGDDEYVISADEKSQLQALRRRHPDLPPAPERIRREEFEYRRGGTLAYLAAYDVHAARVIGRTAPTTGIEPFSELVEQVMNTEPYASAARVFWIVDNGSSHNGARSVERMHAAWPTACLVHLPIHASWLNQVEIFFSIVQRKVIKPGDFADLGELATRLLAFQDRYNATAEPFDWRFGRKSLDRLLERLAVHEPLAA
jgi:transposase